MTTFEANFFQPFKHSPDDLKQYMQNALRDLTIAREDDFSEVTFTYAYQALIKAGIALIAHVGHVKVRSVPGHHVKILEKTSEILGDENLMTLGNAMRMKRNVDFYGGGTVISEKEAQEYLAFAEQAVVRIQQIIQGKHR